LEPIIVIGSDGSALRAASLAEAAGHPVTLLATGALPEVDLPEGRGVWVENGGDSAKTIYGTVQPVEVVRAIVLGGVQHYLPLSAAKLAKILPNRIQAGLDYFKARGAIELAELVGGGAEQRSYQHWIVRRFGSTAFQKLFSSYCQRRFGDPTLLSCNIARYLHGTEYTHRLFAPTTPALRSPQKQLSAKILAITPHQVETDQGTFSGRILSSLPPHTLARLLKPEVEPGILQDTERLGHQDRVIIYIHAPSKLPFETHILDDSTRFFRITRPELIPGFSALKDVLALHFTVSPGFPCSSLVEEAISGLNRLGITATATSARTQTLSAYQPSWEGVHLSRLRRWALALEPFGIYPIGRSGAHSLQDPAEELPYLTAVLNSEQSLRSLIRSFIEPFSEDPPRTHLRRILER
jgi:hypothetical protein